MGDKARGGIGQGDMERGDKAKGEIVWVGLLNTGVLRNRGW